MSLNDLFVSYVTNNNQIKVARLFLFGCLMVLSTTFNNISVVSWRSVLLVEETGGPQTCRKSLTNFII